MATYPGGAPDFVALVPNPQSHAQAVDFAEECQAITDTLGTNPQGGYGTVDARLDALETTLISAGNTGYRGLRVYNDWTTPLTKLVVQADVLGVEGALVSNVPVTIDLTATGKNGMTATRAVSTWYYAWVGQNPTSGEVCGVLDDSSTRSLIDTSHGTLAGFTRWRRVAAVRTNAVGSGELVRVFQHGAFLLYETYQAGSGAMNATANTWATRSLREGVPPTTQLAYVQVSNFVGTADMSTTLGMVGIDVGRIVVTGTKARGNDWITTDASGQIRWKCNESVTAGVYINVLGYQDVI